MNINYRNILHVKFAETAEMDGTGRRFAIPSLPEHTHTHIFGQLMSLFRLRYA